MKLAGILGLAILSFGAAMTAEKAWAQESIQFASVSGRVADPSGAIIAGAQVTALQMETNQKSVADTDREGRFRFPYLRVGQWEIRAHQTGFAEATSRVMLTVGSAFELPFSLAVESTETNVIVTDEAAVLEAARTQIAGTVSQAEVRELPLNGRNFLDLALLVPGVSPTNTASNQLFAETSAVPGVAVIALADLGSIAGALESVKRGADHYLTKPVSADEIAAACARLRGPMHGSAPPVFASLARMEWEYIHRVLADCDGNLSQTARLLGIHRRSLQRKLSKYPPKQ